MRSVFIRLFGFFAVASILPGCAMAGPEAKDVAPAMVLDVRENTANTGSRIRTGQIALPFLFEPAPVGLGGKDNFVLRRPGQALAISPSGIAIYLAPAAKGLGQAVPGSKPDQLDMLFEGARQLARLEAVGQPAVLVNRYSGSRPDGWERNLPAYESLRIRDLYPDTDLLLRTESGQVEYAFAIGPQGKAEAIRLRFAGTRRLSLSKEGDLVVEARNGRVLRHRAPLAVEHGASGTRPLPASFRIDGSDTVSFSVRDRREGTRLTIDPVINFGTYFGGSHYEAGGVGSVSLPIPGLDLAVADDGDILVAGSTHSVDGTSLAFALRVDIDASGTPTYEYLTYLGDTGDDRALAVAAGPRGSAYVCGRTTSAQFPQIGQTFDRVAPVTGAAGFIARLEPDGVLGRSTFLKAGYVTDITACKYENTGAAGGGFPGSPPVPGVYLTGYTLPGEQTDLDPRLVFPGAPQIRYRGHTDIILAKFTDDLAELDYFTLLGGRYTDKGLGVDVVDGVLFATGLMEAPETPMTPDTISGPTLTPEQAEVCDDPIHTAECLETFVLRLNADGTAFDYLTLFGDDWGDFGHGIAVDDNGFAYVSGTRWSGGSIRQAYLAKVRPNGNAFAFNERSPGYSSWGFDVALDTSGVSHVAGATEVWNMSVGDAVDPDYNGGEDGFYAIHNPSGTVDYRTFLGGEGADRAYALVRDHDGCTVIGLETWSDVIDLPLPGAPQNARAGSSDILLLQQCEAEPFEGLNLVKQMTGLVGPGDSGTLRLIVENASYFKSGPFQLRDTLPLPFDLTGVSHPDCYMSGQAVICDFAGIPSGGEIVVVHFTNMMFCEIPGELTFRTNTAKLSGPGSYERTASFDMPYTDCGIPPCTGEQNCPCRSSADCPDGMICKGDWIPVYRRNKIIYHLVGPKTCRPE